MSDLAALPGYEKESRCTAELLTIDATAPDAYRQNYIRKLKDCHSIPDPAEGKVFYSNPGMPFSAMEQVAL
jgi:hypothetical protein